MLLCDINIILLLRKSVVGILLACQVFGTFSLPFGDFSCADYIAVMYRHCKETEDKDMSIVDFITDHLYNFDGLFDKHSSGDDQRPHTPIEFLHHFSQPEFIYEISRIVFEKHALPRIKSIIFAESDYYADYTDGMLRPPDLLQ